MKDETLAIHAGFKSDPTTKAVAVPIYQTVAYEYENAQHGADLFNLAVEGNIYSRIMNPTLTCWKNARPNLKQELQACVSVLAALLLTIRFSILPKTAITL